MADLPRTQTRTGALGVLLFVTLAFVYLIAYRGHALSIDEISTFDSVKSFTQQGTLSRTIEFYRQPTIAADGSPYLPPLYEPLQIIAASPFYLLAQETPIGQFHAIFLLNIVVTALTAVSLYVIGLRLGFNISSAWLTALIYGSATLALPYSRWFFREPLMALFALWAFASAYDVRIRLESRRPVYWSAVILVVATIGMILTKQIGIVFLPGLALCLVPPPRFLRRFLPVFLLLGAAVAGLFVAVAILNPDFGDDRYSLSRWLNPANLGLSHMLESTLGYQISPARSIWLYSPVLLFGFAGLVTMIRQKTRWLVYGIVATVLLTGAAYGALRLGSYWSGGWNWGPRYMLPIIPLWAIFLLPVVDGLGRRVRWQRIVFGGVVLASLAMQIVGIVVPYTDFYNRHYPSLSTETSWLAENWSLQTTAFAYHLEHFSFGEFDSAWRFANQGHLMLLLLLSGLAAALWMSRRILTQQIVTLREKSITFVALPAILVLSTGLGLASLREDGRYIGNRQDVSELINQLNAATGKRDAVFLSGSEYMVLFMNAFKSGSYFSALPDDADAMTPSPETLNALDWAAKQYERIWLIMSPSSYQESHPQSYRRLLSENAYPIKEIVVSPFARAAMYATGHGLTLEKNLISPEVVYGGEIRLEAADLPKNALYTARGVIPFALYWRPIAQPGTDYQLSLQVLDSDGALVAQRDAPPQSGYSRTSLWEPGSLIWDPHAIVLPESLPSGNYSIAVILYRVDTLERLMVAANGQVSDIYVLTQFHVD